MLLELRVENLLLIERAELRLAPGLNVLTGETGAGKTVLAHALDLLLGGRARAIVRPGAAEAYVEGVFELPEPVRAEVGDRLPEDAEELVLARRVSAEGRTRAYLNGRSVGVGELRDLAGGLLTFYGQHEHRRLTLASAQLDVLDGFCGPDQAERRAAYAAAWGRARELRAALEDLSARAGARERELDLLRFELGEIEEAAPSETEEAELSAERERLRRLEGLRPPRSPGPRRWPPNRARAARRAAGRGGPRARGAAGSRPPTRRAGRAPAGRALRGRRPGRRAAPLRAGGRGRARAPGGGGGAPERAGSPDRKHGGTIEAVLAHAERCRARRASWTGPRWR